MAVDALASNVARSSAVMVSTVMWILFPSLGVNFNDLQNFSIDERGEMQVLMA